MNIIEALLIGALQGIFEWLPVSSEGQLMLAMINWIHLTPQHALSIAIFAHIGTALAVLLKFRSDFFHILKNLDSHLSKIIIVSTGSTAITAIPLLIFLKSTFSGGESATFLIGFLLIFTGLLLKISPREGIKDIQNITTRDMVTVGLAQGFAILPGISRSGTTLSVLLLSNIRQETALFISFLMSVPVVLGAVVLDLPAVSAIPAQDIFVITITSLVFGYVTMDMLLRFAKKVNFSMFCILLGTLTVILSAVPAVLSLV